MIIKERNFLFDNTKALLITLVVVGHFADYYTAESEQMRRLFFFIYLFHMPLFIFIAGLFSKSVINGARFKIERVFAYLILFASLKVALFMLQKFVFLNENAQLTFFIEGGIPWFMFAMGVWLSLIYLLRDIKPGYLLTISILGAMLVGLDERVGDFLVSSRIIVYLPYFLIGYYVSTSAVVGFVKHKWVRVGAPLVLMSAIYFIYTQIEHLYPYRFLLTGRNSYASLEWEWIGVVLRLLLFGVVLLLSVSLLAVLPSKKTIFSFIGQRTLSVYFLHYLFLASYHHFQINERLAHYFPNRWLMIYLVISLALTIILALKLFDKPFNYLTSRTFKWIRLK